MSQNNKEEFDLKTLNVIQLYLTNELLQEVQEGDSIVRLWLKLESLYMTNSLTKKVVFETTPLHNKDGRIYVFKSSFGLIQ